MSLLRSPACSASSLVAIACSAPAPPPAINNATPPRPQLVLRMERTECLSGCPEYIVELMSNGSVHWHGIANVHLMGDTISHITEADVQRILDAFRAAKFFDLKMPAEKYRIEYVNGHPVTVICEVLDSPTTKLTLWRDGEPHSYEAPPCNNGPLDHAEELVDELTGAKVWRGIRADEL